MKLSTSIHLIIACLPSISLACFPAIGTRLKTPNELFDAAVYAVYGQVSIPDGSTIRLKVNCVFKSPSLLSPTKPTVEQLMGGSSDIQLTGRFLYNPKSGRPQSSCDYTPQDGSSYLFFLTRKDGNRYILQDDLNPGWKQAMLPLSDSSLPTFFRQQAVGASCPAKLELVSCPVQDRRPPPPALSNLSKYVGNVVIGKLQWTERPLAGISGYANVNLTVSCVLKALPPPAGTTPGAAPLLTANSVIRLIGLTDPVLFVKGSSKSYACYYDPVKLIPIKRVLVYLEPTVDQQGMYIVDQSIRNAVGETKFKC